MAVPKKKGGVRPIAVGEILRRLVGKALCSAAKEDATNYFQPVQVGVGSPLGVDAAVHTARAWHQRNSNDGTRGFLKLDFANAFNLVSRTQALEQVKTHFPGLARWAQWCYQQPSHLVFGSHLLSSETGVQQGDPLGPLLFAAAIHPLAVKLKTLEAHGKKLDLCPFYLDDGFLAGDRQVVAAALNLLQKEGEALGLKLNVGKCELILPCAAPAVDLEELFPHELLVDPETGHSRVATHGCFELLGAAVGTTEHCEAFAAEKVAQAAELLDKLPELADPQIGLRLLGQCAGHCKMIHTMRSTALQLQQKGLSEFDKTVQSTFCTLSITGVAPSHAEWAQACRGLRHAGLGLRSTTKHAPAAYLASATASQELASKLDAQYALSLDTEGSDTFEALRALNAPLSADRKVSTTFAAHASQKQLSAAIGAAGHQARLDEADVVDRATLQSECEPGARALWQAIPSRTMGLTLEPAEFTVEIRARLCMQECANDRWCPLCDAVADTRGHHSRMCCAGGDRVLRHNSVRNFVYRFASAVGLHPELEKAGLLVPALPEEGGQAERRPADVYLPMWVGGAPAALDFAITAPQRQDVLEAAARTPLAAASAYTDRKKGYLGTENACRTQGLDFLPMVAETSGAWAPEAMKVFRQLAAASAARSGKEMRTGLAGTLAGCSCQDSPS